MIVRLAVGLFAFIAAVPLVAAAPSISISAGDVVVSGVTRGGMTLLGVVALKTAHGVTWDSRSQLVQLDENGDGQVTFSTGPLPWRSILIAIDIETGEYLVGSGNPQATLRDVKFPQELLRRDVVREVEALSFGRPTLHAFIVRPGKGAWVLTARDGGFADEDGQADGRLTMIFDAAQAVNGKDNAPKKLKAGDVLAVVDSMQMEVFATRISQ